MPQLADVFQGRVRSVDVRTVESTSFDQYAVTTELFDPHQNITAVDLLTCEPRDLNKDERVVVDGSITAMSAKATTTTIKLTGTRATGKVKASKTALLQVRLTFRDRSQTFSLPRPLDPQAMSALAKATETPRPSPSSSPRTTPRRSTPSPGKPQPLRLERLKLSSNVTSDLEVIQIPNGVRRVKPGIRWSRDGGSYAFLEVPSRVTLRDAVKQRPQMSLKFGVAAGDSLHLSSEGFVVVDVNRRLYVIDETTFARKLEVDLEKGRTLATSPGSSKAYTSANGRLVEIDLVTGKSKTYEVKRRSEGDAARPLNGNFDELAITPDGKHLFAAHYSTVSRISCEANVAFVDEQSKRLGWLRTPLVVSNQLITSPQGGLEPHTVLAANDLSTYVCQWEGRRSSAVAFDPAGELIFVFEFDKLVVRDIGGNELARYTITVLPQFGVSISVAPNGSRLAVQMLNSTLIIKLKRKYQPINKGDQPGAAPSDTSTSNASTPPASTMPMQPTSA